MKYNIVVIAYNRPNSLKRLLNSLEIAKYDEKVDLIISIDKGGSSEVLKIAQDFNWEYGNKEIIMHKKNMGLKKHVLFCGGLSQSKGNLCVLEDDLVVSPNFFSFFKESVNFYEKDDRVAGISLYNHKKHNDDKLPFSSLKSEFDVFLLQYAMSWGQIWTPAQWKKFKDWYDNGADDFFDKEYLPKHLESWSDQSWLKYFIKYCVENDKYFIYPYMSFSTNFSDIGTHSTLNNTDYQVELFYSGTHSIDYRFGFFDELYKYDCFFEIEDLLNHHLGYSKNELTVDLYGNRKQYKTRYILTSRELNYKVINKYGLELKPHEMNIIYNIQGDYFRIYDTSIKTKNKKKIKEYSTQQTFYYYDRLSLRVIINEFWGRFKEKYFK